MLYALRVRPRVAGVKEVLIDAANLIEAEWRGRKVCDEQMWAYISVAPAVIADEASHPMPKAEVKKKAERVGA